jgi:chromosome partitioning protein
VLVVDVDPQANATSGLGIHLESHELSMYDVFMGQFSGYPKTGIGEIIQKTKSGIYLAPSSLELVGAEPFLYTVEHRAIMLKQILEQIKIHYDYILIDTPPSMGQFVINGLVASDHAIVSFDRGVFSLQGLQTLLTIFSDIKELVGLTISPDMAVLIRWGMEDPDRDGRGIRGFFSRISGKRSSKTLKDEEMIKEFEKEVKKYFPLVYTVPFSREIIEAQQSGLPISHFAPDCEAAKAYAGITAVVQTWK